MIVKAKLKINRQYMYFQDAQFVNWLWSSIHGQLAQLSIFRKKNCEKAEKGEKQIHSYRHNAEIHVPLYALTVMNFKSLSRHKYFLTFMTHSIQV